MEQKLLNSKKTVELAEHVFSCPYNEALIHQVVTAYMSAARAGTKAQKTRAEVSGGGAKPWKQKGSGKARAGTTRGPIWRTGGRTFAAKPRSFDQKVNKKMYQGALRSILSELLRDERLQVIDSINITEPKTKDLIGLCGKLKLSGRVLFITNEIDENLYLAARNLPDVAVLDVVSISADPVSLVMADKIIITQTAIKALEEVLQ